MSEAFDNSLRDHPLARRSAALSSLLGTLAWLFSYPSREQAQEVTSREFLVQCRNVAGELALETDFLRASFDSFEEASRRDASERSLMLRTEFTRLFITPPRLVPLEGRRWLKNRTLLSARRGEGFAVGQAYRELGLVNRPETKDPPDHLVSELDFASYIAAAEASAWSEGDAASAREWEQLREGFVRDHLGELACGVALEVRHLSDNAFLLLYASLLHAAVLHGG